MTSLARRILTSAIALPILIAAAFLFPSHHLPLLFIILVLAVSLGTDEMARIVKSKGRLLSLAYLAPLLTIVSYVEKLFGSKSEYTFFLYILLVTLSFSVEVFRGARDDFNETINTLGRSIIVFTYPALLSVFMVNIFFFPNPTAHIMLFFAFVFGEDSFAYFIGMAFGKNNRGIVKVSPKKSIAGFIGGILVPALAGAAASLIFPSVFTFSSLTGAALGALTALFGALGDLVESAFKRSADVKDSGTIMPGRGGILDCLDSLLLGAVPFSIILLLIEKI